MSYHSQKLNRVADDLYRTGEGTYFARVHTNGKNLKESLKTHDRKLAKRKLAEFIKKIENKEAEIPDYLFQDFVDKRLESIKPRLKASSYVRRVSSINQLKPFFKGYKLREIDHERLQKWETARSDVSTASRRKLDEMQ